MQIGDCVKFVDEHRHVHNALLVNVYDNGKPTEFPNPAVSLLFVSHDSNQNDQYGRQIVRKASVAHYSGSTVAANVWHRDTEMERNATLAMS